MELRQQTLVLTELAQGISALESQSETQFLGHFTSFWVILAWNLVDFA